MAPSLTREPFGTLPDGRPVERLWLHGANGVAAAILTYGATVQALHVPDRDGTVADVVLGHDTLEPYVAGRRFFGATAGRYANRIRGGTFPLDGATFRIPANDGPNALHGGPGGFDRKLWTVEAVDDGPEPFVTLGLVSPDGEEGFPGTLTVRLTCRLTAEPALVFAFTAVTDKPTMINLTHHGYFNLAGAGHDVLDHVLTVAAESYLPVDDTAIPLGPPEPVAGTPFDFRSPTPIGQRIREAHEQLRRGRGYDHNFCLDGGRTREPRPVARLVHPGSGRVMEVLTDQPGLQFYSGNFLDGAAPGKGGRLYRQSDGLCLEAQIWPDTPNRPEYPTARLDPGTVYHHTTLYRFPTPESRRRMS